MNINDLLEKRGITKYRLSKNSNIPYTTLNDICSGKAQIEKCSAETIYRLSKELNVSMDELIEESMKRNARTEYRSSFEAFKSNVCHRIKDIGEISFIVEVLESDKIRNFFEKKWFPESLYLLAMVDYLSRENNIPICTNYNDIRACKLKAVLYPSSIIVASAAEKNSRLRDESYVAAIPEFKRFNIVENEVRNVL